MKKEKKKSNWREGMGKMGKRKNGENKEIQFPLTNS